MTQLKFLLLDADVVIRCHALEIWPSVKACCRISLPATIVSEVQFFKSERENKSIDLPSQVTNGEIDCLDATVAELSGVVEQFVPSFCDGLHGGEKEALGLLIGGRFEFDAFCNGDTNAIVAAAMLGCGDKVISLESVVTKLGLKSRLGGRIPNHMTDRSVAHHVAVGKEYRITRMYFRA
jgi:hypothetical protein